MRCSTNFLLVRPTAPAAKLTFFPRFANLFICSFWGLFERFPGDISAVKWPEGLKDLSLYDTNVAGASSVNFCRAPGELPWRAPPAANFLLPTKTAILTTFAFVLSPPPVPYTAPPGCPKHADATLNYISKAACDELRGWIVSQTTNGGSGGGSS